MKLDRSPRVVMAKVLSCSFEKNEFKLQMRYYVHFRINIKVER